MSNFDYKKYLAENKLTSNSRMLNEEDGTYTQKEILRGSMQGFKAPKPEELEVNMMVTPNMAYLDNQELLNQQMGRITAINGDKVTYKKGDGKLYTTEVGDLIIVGGLASEGMEVEEDIKVDELFGFGGAKATEKDSIRLDVRGGSIICKPIVGAGTSLKIEKNDSDFDHIRVGDVIRIDESKSLKITAGKPFNLGTTEVIVDKLFLNGTETKSVTLPS